MKNKFTQLINFIKNNKKKSIIAGIIALLLMVILIIGICFICKSGRQVEVSNTSSQGELKKDNIKSSEQKDKETKKETVKETDTEENTSEKQSEETTSINEAASQDGNEDTTVNEGINNQSVVNSNMGADGGALRVSGTHLVDGNGNVVQLRGISTHGIAWFPDYINRECFKQLHEEFGINVIRLAMYTAEYNGYCTGGDKNYIKNLIDNGVNYATENNMYVIIDWHILSDGNPNTHIEEAKTFFDEMSSKYALHTNVIYEICNEPNGGTGWSDIKNYATQVIDVIRRNDADAVIIVGTPNWCQYVNEAAANPITGYENIMYALHFYAATHKDDLRNTMVQAIGSGLPIFVSEFGICDASGNGSIDETESEKWINLLNRYGVSYVMWSLCNKNETSAMINSSCNKTSGYLADDLSDTGKWFLRLMTGGLNLSQYNDNVPENIPQSNDNQQNNNNQQNSNNQQNNNNQSAEKITVKASTKLINSWETNGSKFYQYEVTVTNNSGKACGSWSTDIKFRGNIQITDGWNGKYTVNGNTLHIESADYNGTLGEGESTGNIGFIISGNGEYIE